MWNAGTYHHLLQAQAFHGRGQPVQDAVELVHVEAQRRPHIKEYPVPTETVLEWTSRLNQPNAGQGFREHPLQMGQLHDVPGLVIHRSNVADFRNRKQAFILGIIACGAMEQIHILHRRQPLNLKVCQAPEMQASADHGMDSAVKLFLLIPAVAEPVSEMLHAAVALAANQHHNALDDGRKSGLVEHRLDFLLSSFGIGQRINPPEVEVKCDLMLRRHLADHARHGPSHITQPGILRASGEKMNVFPVVVIFRAYKALSARRQTAVTGQALYPVIAAGKHFQHQTAAFGGSGGKSAGEEPHERLWTLHQSGYSLVTVRRFRIGAKGSQMMFHMRVNLLAGALEGGLIEAAVAQLLGHVADAGEGSTGNRDQAVEQGAKLGSSAASKYVHSC